MQSIILLSGPIGAGKTTIATQLIANSPLPVAHIEGDKFWFFIAKGGAGAGGKKNFRTIMSAMTAAAVPYALAGYEVILDFSIPPWYLENVQRIAAVRNVPLHYVVLRPSEAVCASRAAARSEGCIPDYTPYRDLYASFDGSRRYMISDDESNAAVVAARIRSGLNEGTFRLS